MIIYYVYIKKIKDKSEMKVSF